MMLTTKAMRSGVDCNGAGQQLHRTVRTILRHAAFASSATALLVSAGQVRSEDAAAASGNTAAEPSLQAPAQPSLQAPAEPSLQEIVVSAQRRAQSLQDVPYNISAVSSSTLENAGFASVNSLTQAVPGLMTVDEGPATRAGTNNFILRGLRTDSPGGGATGAAYQNLTVSPVSTYFGETPVFLQMPLDDLERVEVLRGPQGTLYGSGSQAGTIRFIPKRPDFDGFSGEVSADGSFTQYAQNPNGSVHAVVNIPILDRLALRIVAGEDHQAGFINAVDRVQMGSDGVPRPSVPGDLTSGFVVGPVRKGVNSSDQYFARAALRWEPVDAIDLQVDFLHQHTSMQDSQWSGVWSGGSFDSSFGQWPNAPVETRPGCNHCSTNWAAEPFKDTVNLVDLVGTFDVGLGTVTSSSSYYDDEDVTNFDQTGVYYGTSIPPSAGSAYVPYYPYLGYPRIVSLMRSPTSNSSFIQELRFVSKPGKWLDYVAGLYYQKQLGSVHLAQNVPGINAYTDSIGQHNPTTYGDYIYYYNRHTEFVDKAAFGELTFHATSAWQITGGVRFFRQPFTANINAFLPLCGAICSSDQVNPIGLEPSNSSTTFSNHVWKLNSSYDISPTLKIYATFSEGFRHGGVSSLPSAGPFASPEELQTFKPDLAKNYEIGIKGSLFEHRINYFADIYMVNLYNFQFDSGNLSQVFGAFNGKQARSQGLELESQFAVTDHLNGSLGYAFTRAYVKDSFDIQDYPPYALLPELGGTGQLASLFGGAIAGGTPLPGVSRHVVTASADYTLPSGLVGPASWIWRLHGDASYRSAENSSINPNSIYQFVIPSAFVGNVRLWLDTPQKMSYSLFIRNVTNNPQISGGINDQEFDNPYRLRNIGTPRTYGLGVRYQF